MFFLFFIIIPLIEVMLFITIGKYIGLLNTIIIIIITGILGAILVKSQGISTLKKGLEEIKSNKIPIHSLFEGIAIVIAGAFLLTPGFLTDTFGAILLIPKLRNLMIKYIVGYLEKRTIYTKNFKNDSNDEKTYEGKFEEINEDEEKK